MEFVSRLRWLIVIFLVLVFLILVGWGLSSIARNIFNSSNSNGSSVSSESSMAVNEVDVTRFTVSGSIVASAEHRSYTIEVNPNTVTITLYSDYGQKELDQKSYRNNQEAFNVFLAALEAADIASRIRGTDTEDDLNYEGACSSGRRYIVELDDDFQRWATSCDSVSGTLSRTKMGIIRRLFNNQAPDAKDILTGTGLYIN